MKSATNSTRSRLKVFGEMSDDQVKQIATNVVDSLAAIEESFRLAKLDLLKRENELFKPLYAKREKFTSAIPHFWSTVLAIDDELSDFIQEGEADLLKSCTSLRVEKRDDDPRDFSISMTFSKNAYLEDTSCSFVKDFKFDAGVLTSRVVKLDWKQGKDLTSIAAKEKRLSFFSLFSFVGATEEEDDEVVDEDDPQLILEDMAMLLLDEVYPHALSYFTDALLPPPDNEKEATTNGAGSPMMLESMTTSFLDQQEKVQDSRGNGKSHQLTSNMKEVERYSAASSTSLPDFLNRHRQESIDAFNEVKMVTINEAQFLHFIAAQLGVKRVLEIGCFTGYSAMIFAAGGAEDVITCELDQELASFAKLAVHRAGLSDKIRVVHGDAHNTIRDSQIVQGEYDLIFIDAEKRGYLDYIKVILGRNLLAKTGVIVADNTLRRGLVVGNDFPERHRVIESPQEREKNDMFEEDLKGMRAFNDFLTTLTEFESVLLPVWDGCTLIRRK